MVYKIFSPKFTKHLKVLCVNEKFQQEHFYLCQWQKSQNISIWFMIYRILMTITTVGIMILSLINQLEVDPDYTIFKWFIYMTHWGYLIIVLQFLLATLIHTYYFIKEKLLVKTISDKEQPSTAPEATNQNQNVDLKKQHKINLVCKFYGVIHAMAAVLAIGITVLYWVLIYNPEIHKINFINLAMHAMNSIIMLIDLMLVAHPMYLLHVIYPFLFAIIYTFFTYFYYLAGGKGKEGQPSIYEVLDWNRPVKSIIVSVSAILFVVILFFMTYLLVFARKYCKYKCAKPKQIDDAQSTPNNIPTVSLNEVTINSIQEQQIGSNDIIV
ncbi:protein rolling stone-like [Chrysoperla carnea]|uniref:protein rolling stone-like n=1 Tax=Chrysoperla carnea TaxID=189513 RepID=UPI001D093F46|nr:protein rolling stone-like [Chrysoperla carnea]